MDFTFVSQLKNGAIKSTVGIRHEKLETNFLVNDQEKQGLSQATDDRTHCV